MSFFVVISKFLAIIILVCGFFNATWCATSWLPLSSNRSKVYSNDDVSQKEFVESENVNGIKRKPLLVMPSFKWWGKESKNSQVLPIENGSETASETDEESSKNSGEGDNSLKNVDELRREALILIKEATKAEEIAWLKKKKAEEAVAHLAENEEKKALQAKRQKARVIESEPESKEIFERSKNANGVVVEFQSKLNEAQQSARLAEARAIRDKILLEKARKEAEEKRKKEIFQAERQAILEIEDAPRIAAAEACFINENEGDCRQLGCSWNSLLNVCDIDCNAFRKEKSCHSAIGIRSKGGDERTNKSIIADKEYVISRICLFDTNKKRCTLRAARF